MAAGLLAAAAAAQTVPNALPGAAEPGRKVPAAPTPPPLKLRWTLELPAGPAPPEVLADETLTLNEVRLDGVTVYHRADLRDLFEPYLGKEITLRAFYGIAAAIQARYQADGYLLSFAYVPPQSVDDGVFTIAVVEGYVDKVVVEDLEGALKRTLERTLAAITRARPLRAEVLERQMLLANDLAGVTASGVLQPSRDAVGAAQLIVKTSLDRVAGSVVIDNRGSPYTGPWEATGRVDLNTPFGLGERLSASATVTRRPRELRSFGLGYAQPLGAYGLRLDLDLGYALSAPGFTLRRFEVETTSLSADLRLSYPIIRSRDQTLSLGGGLSFLDSEVDLLDSRFSRDRLRSARLGLTYNRRGLIGGNSSSSLALRLTLDRALAVRSYLIKKGVRSTRMDVRALGNGYGDGPADRVDLVLAERKGDP